MNDGKMIKHLEDKGILDEVDIFFAPDHGGMDGAFGTLLIGPSMTDHIRRLPSIWQPARGVVDSHDGIMCVLHERTKTYKGTEGDLFDLYEDPGELVNLWDDPK